MISAQLVDWMGDDNSIVTAARVSFAKEASNYTEEQNHRLINFLARERHELPFAHTAITLRCSAPVPIRTQCFKSKVGFVENEESRRYITSTPELFVPDAFREAVKDKKQGSGGVHEWSSHYKRVYEDHCRDAIEHYLDMIRVGICPEQARFILPQGIMVNWIWTGSLLAYSRFCKLRLKPDAQAEVRIMAEQVSDIMAGLYPVSWSALQEEYK